MSLILIGLSGIIKAHMYAYVIPELASLYMTPISMMATALAALVYRKERDRAEAFARM